MAKGKKSFIAYTDWKAIFDTLTDEQAGILIKHIFAYVNDENPQIDNILIKIAFAGIKQQLKRDLIKWGNISMQRAEAGRIGGIISKRKQNKQMQANQSKPKQIKANKADNVNDNDIVIVNVNEKNKEKNIIPPTLEMVTKYCNERGNNIDPQYFIDNNSLRGWVYGKNKIKIKDWQACIRTWEQYEKRELVKKDMMP